MLDAIKLNIRHLKNADFLPFTIAQVLQKLVTFCGGLLIVRILTKGDYGYYTYANNLIAMVLLLDGIGAAGACFQYGCISREEPLKCNAYQRLGLAIGLPFNVAVGLGLIAFTYLFPQTFPFPEALPYVRLIALRPAAAYLDATIAANMRIRLENRRYAVYTTVEVALTILGVVLGALLGGVRGTFLGQYAAYAITFIVGLAMNPLYRGVYDRASFALSRQERREFLRFAFIGAFNTGLSSLLYQIDVFVLGIYIKNAEVIASYQVAATIPTAMCFVPATVAQFLYPYFNANRMNKAWLKENYRQILLIFGAFNVLLSLGMILFAPLIIRIVFTDKYMDAVLAFRILAGGYFINATFLIISGNLLLSLGKIKFNALVSGISGLMNLCLNVPMILWLGSAGAAIATVIVSAVTGAMGTLYLWRTIRRLPDQPPAPDGVAKDPQT